MKLLDLRDEAAAKRLAVGHKVEGKVEQPKSEDYVWVDLFTSDFVVNYDSRHGVK